MVVDSSRLYDLPIADYEPPIAGIAFQAPEGGEFARYNDDSAYRGALEPLRSHIHPCSNMFLDSP